MSSDKELLESIKEHREAYDWILEQQATLRAELMTFYKKDLKEIQTSLSSIEGKEAENEFTKLALEYVQEYFLGQWMRSYNLITPNDCSVKVSDRSNQIHTKNQEHNK